MDETVNHPRHYTKHPSGIECIEISEHLGFNLGNAFKYLFRRNAKHEDPTSDIRKALWYIEREANARRDGVIRRLFRWVGRQTLDLAVYDRVTQVLMFEHGRIGDVMAIITSEPDAEQLFIAARYLKKELEESCENS